MAKPFDVAVLADLPVWKIAYLGTKPVVRVHIVKSHLEQLGFSAETTPEELHDYFEWNDIFPLIDEIREEICQQAPELKGMEIFSTPLPELQREDICFFAISRQPPLQPPVAIAELAP